VLERQVFAGAVAGACVRVTLFCPASGQVRVKGVRRTANAVLHPWLEAKLEQVLATLPAPVELPLSPVAATASAPAAHLVITSAAYGDLPDGILVAPEALIEPLLAIVG